MPTVTPTAIPTVTPTAIPTVTPTAVPTVTPTAVPTVTPTGDTWNASTIYNSGDTVVVNGVTYKAQWWTKGENPTTTGTWGVWKKV
ncbi:carbohydrate-binding protein [Psychromonas hadalis]|uniref:carbohydrate-binding protein n=1 Tax=Psychromonas hadalis TaxID=211669 RepID=UPI003CCB9EDC